MNMPMRVHALNHSSGPVSTGYSVKMLLRVDLRVHPASQTSVSMVQQATSHGVALLCSGLNSLLCMAGIPRVEEEDQEGSCRPEAQGDQGGHHEVGEEAVRWREHCR